MSAFWVKLGANDLNCVDVPLNPNHSLTLQSALFCSTQFCALHLSMYSKTRDGICTLVLGYRNELSLLAPAEEIM